MRTVTTKVDVFSFGILMMELFTGRRPTGTIEENGMPLTLQQFVENALTSGLGRVLEIVEQDMILRTQMEEDKVVGVLELALSCTRISAEDRPDMNEVLSSLLKLRKDDDNC